MIAIMQPTYLSWPGYFNLLSRVSDFVFLDDAQFNPRSWQQRNRILVNGSACWLSVPVLSTGQRQKINEVRIDQGQKWRKKHWLTLQQSYSNHPFGRDVLKILAEIYANPPELLSELNLRIIRTIAEFLNIETNLHLSSNFPSDSHRSNRLLEICHRFKATTYLSPIGSQAYLEEDKTFTINNVSIIYQNFNSVAYPQRGSAEFVPYLSIVDLIANVGYERTRAYVVRSAEKNSSDDRSAVTLPY